MKHAIKKITDFTLDILKDYLIDKAVGTLIVTAFMSVVCFAVLKQIPEQPPTNLIVISKIFDYLGATSLFISAVTVTPAIIKVFSFCGNWLLEGLFSL